jgi:hypothetical protein
VELRHAGRNAVGAPGRALLGRQGVGYFAWLLLGSLSCFFGAGLAFT